MTPAAEDVERVLAEYPELGVHGFQVYPPLRPGNDFVEQVEVAHRWLSGSPARRRLLVHRGSYFVKHRIEESTRIYVSNGAAVVAAVLAGYEPVRSRPSPNCMFKQR